MNLKGKGHKLSCVRSSAQGAREKHLKKGRREEGKAEKGSKNERRNTNQGG